MHIHDICLPDDYGPLFVERYWTEQYLLATLILGGAKNIKVLYPNYFAFKYMKVFDFIQHFHEQKYEGLPKIGSSFWFEINNS